MMLAPPALVPDAVNVTAHARQRYEDRRSTCPAAVDAGIARLLHAASLRPTPPLRLTVDGHPPHRSLTVSGFKLVFDADMSTLITMWRHGR